MGGADIFLRGGKNYMDELNAIYEKIGADLAGCMDNDWETIVLDIECSGNMAGTRAKYLSKGKWIDNLDRTIGVGVLRGIIKLYELTKTLNFVKWNSAVYTLEKSGHFNMDFKWNQELQDEWDGKR